MLKLKQYVTEDIDEETGEIKVTFSGPEFQLEHSLLSVSEWETKYQKPFLSDKEKNVTELIDYIEMMVVSRESDAALQDWMTQHHMNQIQEYIASSPTATWFNDRNQQNKRPPQSSEVVTSELIYYWMFSLRISKECESWNLNRLLTLIKVFDAKEKKPEKMSKRDIMNQNKALNAQRRAKMNSKG